MFIVTLIDPNLFYVFFYSLYIFDNVKYFDIIYTIYWYLILLIIDQTFKNTQSCNLLLNQYSNLINNTVVLTSELLFINLAYITCSLPQANLVEKSLNFFLAFAISFSLKKSGMMKKEGLKKYIT